jgi:hypothetical protein
VVLSRDSIVFHFQLRRNNAGSETWTSPYFPSLNYLSQLAEETGGELYWLGTSNPVSFAPYLNELNQHFRGQHILTFLAQGKPGYRRVKLKTEIPHVALVGPSKAYVPSGK